MSDKPAPNTKEPHTSRPKSGASNRTGLLLAGAAAVALLMGGGYYAWKQSDAEPGQIASTENATSFASPSSETEATLNGAPTQKAVAAPPVAAPPAAQPPAKKATVAAAKVPEETVGVAQGSTRGNQTDEVVVNARRSIWRYTPTAERLAEYYPARALERGREGEARLRCMVREKGKLDCERVSETPARQGFGSAALQVAHRLRHADQRRDGSNAIGTPLTLRVVFRMEEGRRRS